MQSVRNVLLVPLAVLLEAKYAHGPPSTGAVHPTGNGSFTGSRPVWPTSLVGTTCAQNPPYNEISRVVRLGLLRGVRAVSI